MLYAARNIICFATVWTNGRRRNDGSDNREAITHRFLINESIVNSVVEERIEIIDHQESNEARQVGLPFLLEAMKQAKRPIAIVPDGDAWQDGWILAARLRFLGLRAGYVRLPPKMDPDEVDRDWLLAESAACIDRGL